MKTLFESFTNCELSESELSLIPGGKCPCPEDPEDPENPGGTTTSGNPSGDTSTQTVVYYYYYY